MTRSQGFVRGDLDAAFPLDDKFLALRGRVPVERYYAATGVYFHVAAAMWREAERKPASKVCPDAGQAIADLVAVGLLGDDECVNRRAFTNSVGRAKRNRRAASVRQARNRAGKSREVTRDTHATDSESPPARDSVGPVLQGTDSVLDGKPAREPRTPRQSVLRWLSDHGAASPTGWANGSLNELVRIYGAPAIVDIWDHAPSDVRTSRQFVQLAERSLAPAPLHPKNGAAKGLGPTSEEAERAFSR